MRAPPLAPSLTLRPDGPGGRTSFTLHAMLRHADAPGGGAGPAWLPPEGTVWPNPHGRIPLGRFLGEPDYDHFSVRTRHLGYVLHTLLNERWVTPDVINLGVGQDIFRRG